VPHDDFADDAQLKTVMTNPPLVSRTGLAPQADTNDTK
jgi:hypothetical protein